MRYALGVIGACLLSLALYVLTFGAVVSRPLVVDINAAMLDKKLHHAAQLAGSKIFILAGSNARFSHSCAVIESALKLGCVNLGITADASLDWVIENAKPYIKPGDVVYMPVEYGLYSRPRLDTWIGPDAAYMFRHDRAMLWRRGPEGLLDAAFMFDLPYLINAAGEMALASTGFHRRYGTETLDAQGDETGNTDVMARSYETYLKGAKVPALSTAMLMADPHGEQADIAAFLDWCSAHGVRAIGGLPTTFADNPIPASVIFQLADFYRRHGAGFVVLANKSQYPRSAFYDTPDHLRESAQKTQSRLVAQALRSMLSGPGARQTEK